MSRNHRSLPTLASLLPAGALGLSAGLAAGDAAAAPAAAPDHREASVSERLLSLRLDVTAALEQYRKGEPFVIVDREQTLAWWGNGGWRNGGWRNWGNGGWHNGWHNW